MAKSITILDPEYRKWVLELKERYRRSQIKAATKVNQEMIQYYWDLGRDIVEMHVEDRWGEKVIRTLAADLKREMSDATGLSRSNLYYTKRFYLLYSKEIQKLKKSVWEHSPQSDEIVQQVAGQLQKIPDTQIVQQAVGQFMNAIYSVPWGHHIHLIDKFEEMPEKAMFYIRKTIEESWSRSVMDHFIDSDLYAREGKALTNFSRTLPAVTGDLAQELTKDPYSFAFTGITGKYNERLLKDALLANITKFLIELGTGFAYVGKEYRLKIGETENYIDLLFYNLNLSCYVVVEVKIGKLAFADAGQLGGYVVACNHLLRKEGRDNPTIGLLICKEKDRVVAQYALEASNQPLGISEYDLAKLYPEKIEGMIPTIEELEANLENPQIEAKKDDEQNETE
jgi:predicted nuclease of restriction endonuclease-like (RecB) superfamily